VEELTQEVVELRRRLRRLRRRTRALKERVTELDVPVTVRVRRGARRRARRWWSRATRRA
jgi:predicted RNase H-like nuclease (RuvC/YqgF family)